MQGVSGVSAGAQHPIRISRLRAPAGRRAHNVGRRARRPVMTWLFSSDVIMTRAAERLHSADDVEAPGQRAPLDLTVFISCYNEGQYIVATIETVRDALNEIGSISYEIIVIDDRSKDDSSALVTGYIAAHPDERVLLRTNRLNRG